MPKAREQNPIAPETPEELTIYTVAPEWVELTEKHQALLKRRDELIAEVARHRKELVGSGLVNFHELNLQGLKAAREAAGKPPRTIGPSEKASNLLGKFSPEPKPAPEPFSFEPRIAREMRERGEELAALQEAIDILQPQLTRAHLEGSARLCELLMPEYRTIARRICAALVELGNAELMHRQFMHRHRNAARSMLRPVQGIGWLGDPLEPASELRRLLEWAIECGHFDAADLPAEWPRNRHARAFLT